MGRHPWRMGLSAVAVIALLTACIVAEPVVVKAPPPLPPVQVEVAPARPGPAYVWVPGHWVWRRRGYVWRPGHWIVPAGPNYVWVPGHWAPQAGGYVWADGHWELR